MRALFVAPAVALALGAATIVGCQLAPPDVCAGDPGAPTPSPDQVCEHLAALECFAGPVLEFADGGAEAGVLEVGFDAGGSGLVEVHAVECRAGHGSWERYLDDASFAALVRCYVAARDCAEVEACNRGCALTAELDAGVETDGGGPIDADDHEASVSDGAIAEDAR